MISKGIGRQSAAQIYIGLVLGAGALAVATAILKAFAFEHYLYNVALVFIVIVLLVATRYGLWAGIGISVLGFLSLDFFFIEPYLTLFIDSGAGIVAVLSFLIAASVTSQIAALARRKTEEAEDRQRELVALNAANVAVLSELQPDRVMSRLVAEVAMLLHAQTVRLYLPAHDANERVVLHAVYPSAVADDSDIDRIAIRDAYRNKTAVYTQPMFAYLPLVQGNDALGVLVVRFDGDLMTPDPMTDMAQQRWLTVVANQAALGVEHARVIEQTAQVALLTETDRLKSTLLATISHELRTPLMTIKMAVTGLQTKSIALEPHEQTEYLSLIDQEADRLTRLISNILDLSRIEAGILKPNKELAYIPEIVAEVVERTEQNALVREHTIITDYAPDIPLIEVDYVQIDQVVTNLLDNAAKYSPKGSRITISVHAATKPDADTPGVEVAVVDEGEGLAESEVARIFDKFYRVDNRLQATTPGTGLGLAICKGIIEAHNGVIWARPRLYGGLIVSFWLPATPVSLSNPLLSDNLQGIHADG